MKPNKRQLGFDILDPPLGNKEPTTHDVDYTQMDIGTGVGHRKVVVECGKCGRGCVTKHNDKNLVWIHSQVTWLTGKGDARSKIVSACRKGRFDD